MELSGVYAIVDVSALDAHAQAAHPSRPTDVIGHAKSLLSAPLAALQLRAKDAPGGRVLALATELAKLARAAGVPFFVNDRVDIALLVGAGVHLGQDDVSPVEARALAERAGAELRIGFSTHDEAQALAASELPIDYLAIGPVFATKSKLRPDPVLGPERAGRIATLVRAKRAGLPIVAIGGIDAPRARELAGIDAVAVIGALLPEEGEPADTRVRAIAQALGKVPR